MMAVALRALALPLALALAACGRDDPAPEPVRAVRTMVVAEGSATSSLEFAGEVRARIESRLGFRVPGKIVARQVQLGDQVKRGQVLARLDARDLRLSQEAAKAALAAAQANLDQAGADFKRFKDLREKEFISSAELERRETALKAAQSQADQARAQLDVQGNQARYADLVADASGVVTAIEAEPGMVVSAGMPVVRLAHDGPRDVVFSVPEDKIALLRSLAGSHGRLKVALWGRSGERIDAKVREVAAAADPVTRTFLVKADIGRTDAALGQTATATIELQQQDNLVKLPLSAVVQMQGRSSVWVLDKQSMTVQPQPVEVGGAENNQVIVKSGLQPGQAVVIAGAHVLTPGQKVKQYVEPNASGGSEVRSAQ